MKVFELLSKPEAWTKGAMAHNRARKMVSARSPKAVSWCVAGAVEKCYGSDENYISVEEKIWALEAQIEQSIPDVTLTQWNDDPDRKHEEVVNLLKKLNI